MPRRENERADEYRDRLRREAKERSRKRYGRTYTPPVPTPANARYVNQQSESPAAATTQATTTSQSYVTTAGDLCGCDHVAGWHYGERSACGYPGCMCSQFHAELSKGTR